MITGLSLLHSVEWRTVAFAIDWRLPLFLLDAGVLSVSWFHIDTCDSGHRRARCYLVAEQSIQ